jgi:Secretion system C-terminal sorting domain
MKTKLLIFIFFINGLFCLGQSIQINQITPTAVNGGININVLVTTFNGAGYLSHSYTVTENTINLDVCYWFNLTLPVYQISTDFLIPVSNTQNYTINLSTFNSTSNIICNFYSTGPTASRQFLDVKNFENDKNSFIVFPNPSDGIFEFKENYSSIKQIKVYDFLGKIIKEINNFKTNQLDLSILNNGVYHLEIESELGINFQKVVVNK